MKKNINKLKNNKGITGIDLVISTVIIFIFVGLLTSLMSAIYKNSLEIQKSANAMAYVTMVLEKVDEKSFEEVQAADFLDKLKSSGEITIGSGYSVTLYVGTLANATSEIDSVIKKVTVTVRYTINKEEKVINISKLKVKEMDNGNS